jgi:iron complex outermembrane receptor protein
MQKQRSQRPVAWAIGATIGIAAAQVLAAEAEGPAEPGAAAETGLEEVVVTAQRREENLQRAAVAVTAISGNAIQNRGVTRLSDLTQLVPALKIESGAGPYTGVSLRGVATAAVNSFADPAIAVNLDGIYLPRPTSPQGLFYDIERVEVLKGPQGTLYGRNATGGAINVITKAPRLGEFGGDVTLDAGNYQLFNGTGAINVPLGDSAAMRAAFQVVSRDGYFSDGSSDEKRQSGRLSFRMEPTDDVTLTLRADYTHLGGKGTGATAYCVGGLPVGNTDPNTPGKNCTPTGQFYGDPWTGLSQQSQAIYPPVFPVWTNPGFVPTGVRPAIPLTGEAFQDIDMYMVSGQMDWQFGGGTLTVLPAYRREDVAFLSESAGFQIAESSRTHQESLEVRFASNTQAALSYVAGAFYLNTGNEGTAAYDAQGGVSPPPVGIFPPAPNSQLQHTDNDGSTGAVFGQLTYAISPRFRLTGGGRYTTETKSTDSDDGAVPYYVPTPGAVPPPGGPTTGLTDANGYLLALTTNTPILFRTSGSRTWHSFNWKVGVEADIAEQSLLYANVGTGFKSGGFFFSPLPGIENITYEPEKLTAYTLGSKNRFLDNALQVNLEAFHWVYKDQQVAGVALIPPFIIFPQQNAQQATINGAELDVQYLAPTKTLLTLDAQYSLGKYDTYRLLSAFPATGCRLISPGPPVLSDCSGNHLVNAPNWTIGAGLQQTFGMPGGGALVFDVNAHFESTRLVGLSPYQSIDSNTRTDASVRFESQNRNWSIEAYVNNLSDEVTPTGIGQSVNFVPGLYTAGLRPPRTYGGRFSVHF